MANSRSRPPGPVPSTSAPTTLPTNDESFELLEDQRFRPLTAIFPMVTAGMRETLSLALC